MKHSGEILLGLLLAGLLGCAFALWLFSGWLHATSPDDARPQQRSCEQAPGMD